MAPKVAFYTLGCKLNQLETESFAEAFARSGCEVLAFDIEASAEDGAAAALPQPADLFVINTCTVTGKADRKARRMIRLALAANPRAAVLITGCYAQVDAPALAALGERVVVLPGQGKERLLALPGWLSQRQAGGPEGSPAVGTVGADLPSLVREWLSSPERPVQDRFAFNPRFFSFHSRPSLKIQDGCDNECAYCQVRVARGSSMSLPAAEVLARARALEAAGRAEIVLTGVNLSQYRDGGIDFPSLLKLLLDGTTRIAFRLSSYEPDRIDASFLEAFSHPRVRPHVHLALQSGSGRTLASMGRRYGPADVISAVEALRRARKGPFIAADFISGFPGESDEDAAESLSLARACDFAWIHSFRFSPRPGTRAAAMSGRVPERLASARAQALSDLGRAGKARYIERNIGERAAAVLEIGLTATSDNYLHLKLRGLPSDSCPGQAIECTIEAGPNPDLGDRVDGCAVYIDSG